MNQVVKNNGRPVLAVFVHVGVAVLKYHQRGRFTCIVLCRDVHIVATLGTRVDFTLKPLVFRDGSLRRSCDTLRVFSEEVPPFLGLGFHRRDHRQGEGNGQDAHQSSFDVKFN